MGQPLRVIEIPLRRRDGTIRAHALIDDEDHQWAQHKWYLANGYARRDITVDGKTIRQYLHRELMGLVPGDGIEGDHRNGNRLDCRRKNLRLSTRAQNAQNKSSQPGSVSKYRGVFWDKSRQRWQVIVKLHGRKFHLGRYDDEEAAAKAASFFRNFTMTHTNEARRVRA